MGPTSTLDVHDRSRTINPRSLVQGQSLAACPACKAVRLAMVGDPAVHLRATSAGQGALTSQAGWAWPDRFPGKLHTGCQPNAA